MNVRSISYLRYVAFALTCIVASGCSSARRKLLYYPTHHLGTNQLQEWKADGDVIGYHRPVDNPEAVWLFVHGNGGQASDRVYALQAFSQRDAVYIVEYPGYGLRPGIPSKESLDQAVLTAYRILRLMYRNKPVCVGAESIGSGPASLLARESLPPDKMVFVVPFDVLKKVASDHVPFLPAGLLLGHSWDNVNALQLYKGPIDIFAARDDQVIPLRHAEALAKSLPQARFVIIAGGHNDWVHQKETRFRLNE